MDLNQPEAEEFIQHYSNTYSSLKKELKMQNPLSDVESKFLRKALKFTSNLPGDLYTPAEYVEEVESFTETINAKFNSEYGPNIYDDKSDILEFRKLAENSWEKFSKNTSTIVIAVKKKMMKKKKK